LYTVYRIYTQCIAQGCFVDRTKDGMTAKEYQAALDKSFAVAHKKVDRGESVKRTNRLVITVTDLTFDRLAYGAGRFMRFGEWEKSTKSGIANYLICRGLAALEQELLEREE
jgi:hypothetical protein